MYAEFHAMLSGGTGLVFIWENEFGWHVWKHDWALASRGQVQLTLLAYRYFVSSVCVCYWKEKLIGNLVLDTLQAVAFS